MGEELGLIGTTVTLLCFCVIAWRGLNIAAKAEDRFGSLMAIGVTTMIAAQAFINMSVVIGLLPTKGIPLPFLSSGGSSLLVSLLVWAVILNISQHERRMRRLSMASPAAAREVNLYPGIAWRASCWREDDAQVTFVARRPGSRCVSCARGLSAAVIRSAGRKGTSLARWRAPDDCAARPERRGSVLGATRPRWSRVGGYSSVR